MRWHFLFFPLLISTGGNACIGPNLEVVSVCWCAERNLIWLWLHPFDMGALMNSFGIYIFNYQSALQIPCKSGQNGISQVRTWYKSSAMKVEICWWELVKPCKSSKYIYSSTQCLKWVTGNNYFFWLINVLQFGPCAPKLTSYQCIASARDCSAIHGLLLFEFLKIDIILSWDPHMLISTCKQQRALM